MLCSFNSLGNSIWKRICSIFPDMFQNITILKFEISFATLQSYLGARICPFNFSDEPFLAYGYLLKRDRIYIRLFSRLVDRYKTDPTLFQFVKFWLNCKNEVFSIRSRYRTFSMEGNEIVKLELQECNQYIISFLFNNSLSITIMVFRWESKRAYVPPIATRTTIANYLNMFEGSNELVWLSEKWSLKLLYAELRQWED